MNSILDKNKSMGKLNGRLVENENVLNFIVEDILEKLNIVPGMSFLDIGCGSGDLTLLLISRLQKLDCDITLLDFPKVIEELEENMNREGMSFNKVNFIKSTFPVSDSTFTTKKYSRILAYSVIHYSEIPESFIEQAVFLLNEQNCSLLIGDVPNVNYNGRFLCSEFGKKFESNYKNIDLSELPVFRDHKDYAEKTNNQNKLICDDLIVKTFAMYRSKGYDVFVINQKKSLPFSFSREDLLIKKY